MNDENYMMIGKAKLPLGAGEHW